jgi:hypothetical protein
MKGGTGVFIENNNLEANFIDFLQNSNIVYLSKGSYGVIFRVTINPTSGYVSKYKNIDYSVFGTSVNSLIVKISSLGYLSSTPDSLLDTLIRPVSEEDFIREVNIQTEVFLKTMNTLEPLCPAIVYSDTYKDTEKTILDIIYDKLVDPNEKNYVSSLRNYVSGYSVIGMELLRGFETVHSLIHYIPSNKKLYQSMTTFILIELALKTGYAHSDFHYGNIMINPNELGYFKGIGGSVSIIDFGLAVKIRPEILNSLKNFFKRKEYSKIIYELCQLPRADGLIISDHLDSYKICKITPDSQEITELFDKKEEATDDIIQFFNSKTDERDKYPLLPLSNAIKQQMFPGMIEKIANTEELQTITLKVGDGLTPDELVIFSERLFIVIDWVCEVCKIILYSKNGRKISLSRNKSLIKYVIDACYITAYLLGNVDFAEESKHQLAGIVGMYCAGIDELFQYKYNPSMDIFETYEYLSSNIYSDSTIFETCEKYKEQLKNIRFVTIYDFMTQNELTKLEKNFSLLDISLLDSLSDIMTSDINVYNNPREWVNTRYPKENLPQEEYEFPYKEEETIEFGIPKPENVNKNIIKSNQNMLNHDEIKYYKDVFKHNIVGFGGKNKTTKKRRQKFRCRKKTYKKKTHSKKRFNSKKNKK